MPDIDWRDRPVLILGAGGAARAVLHGLRKAGVPRLIIANRNRDKAEQLAALFGGEAIAWDAVDQHIGAAGLLVNTTSLGMQGQPALECPLEDLPRTAIVCDIVYAPLMTPLLIDAHTRGNPVVTGIGMLLHQAALAFQMWTGIMPTVDAALETIVLECIRHDRARPDRIDRHGQKHGSVHADRYGRARACI